MKRWISNLVPRPTPAAPKSDPAEDALVKARLTLVRERVPNVAHCDDGIDPDSGRELMIRLLADTATLADRREAESVYTTRLPRSAHLPLNLGWPAPCIIADPRWRAAVQRRIGHADAGPNLRALISIFEEICRYYDAYLAGLLRPGDRYARYPLSAFGAIGRIETLLSRRRFETIDELAGASRLGISLLPQAPLPTEFTPSAEGLLWVLRGALPGPQRAWDRASVEERQAADSADDS